MNEFASSECNSRHVSNHCEFLEQTIVGASESAQIHCQLLMVEVSHRESCRFLWVLKTVGKTRVTWNGSIFASKICIDSMKNGKDSMDSNRFSC